MKKLLLLLALGCGSGVDSTLGKTDAGTQGADGSIGVDAMPTFDGEVEQFKETTCEFDSVCTGRDKNECLYDVTNDMIDAKAMLDAAGENRCALCMQAKTRELMKILAASCDAMAGDIDAIYDACDLDPNDGVNSHDQACAGYP